MLRKNKGDRARYMRDYRARQRKFEIEITEGMEVILTTPEETRRLE